VIVVLLAAVVHATWNAIAHRIPDHLVAFTWLGIGGMLGALPLVLIAPAPHAQSWPFLGTSIVLLRPPHLWRQSRTDSRTGRDEPPRARMPGTEWWSTDAATPPGRAPAVAAPPL
jgi:hypothetical protein